MKAKDPQQLWEIWKQKHIISSMISAICLFLSQFSLWYIYGANMLVILLALCFGVYALWKIFRSNLPGLKDAITLINEQNPALEYSGDLINSEHTTTLLATLQKEKAIHVFQQQAYRLPPPFKSIQHSIVLVLSLFILVVISQNIFINKSLHEALTESIDKQKPSEIDSSAMVHSYYSKFNLRIQPPTYTGLKAKSYTNGNIQIPEGSSATWAQSFQNEPFKVFLIINDIDTIDLKYPYIHIQTVNSSLFYRYGWEGKDSSYISEYNQIKVIPDTYAEVIITGAEEYTKVPFRKNIEIPFNIVVQDDYGIENIDIIATIAKGSGESVQFRERNIPAKDFRSGSKSYQGIYQFIIKDLKMSPGDELYWYVRAKDNCSFADHWSKSITHTFALEDTTRYTFTDAGGMQVDLMPEFFRSQRQIIIDSEKLLEKKHLISKDSFNRESNSLGYDQKMLRLKYGQFLGEESESGIAIENEVESGHGDSHEQDEDILGKARNVLEGFMHDHDHEDEAMNEGPTSTKEKENISRPSWVEELSHNHDSMEEASFYEISVKSKLKAALSVMWDAELHLRLYDPTTSLPFQYESLDYLQEIKNHARIYVHRMGFDPPVIKEAEKRLKGKQQEIEPAKITTTMLESDQYAPIKEFISVLGIAYVDPIEIQGIGSALAMIILNRPEVLPVMGLWEEFSKNPSPKSQLYLRNELIKLLPREGENIENKSLHPHQITRQVTMKMSQSR